MHRIFPLFCLLAAFVPGWTQNSITGSFEYNGETRVYRLYLPEAYDGAESWPLVFNLHGYGSNAVQQEFYAQMLPVADTAHFLVCHPDGLDNQWNVGFGTSDTDDTGFLNALIDTLLANYNVDSKRVYSCGMSNGGFMSYKLACELTDRIAAIASVTGSMVEDELLNCQPSRKIPIMQVHGTEDPVVFYEGSGFNLGIEAVLDFWIDFNGCSQPADTTAVPDTSPIDGCTADRIWYNNCEEGTEVLFYKVYGGGHTWPGADIPIGVTNLDFDASVEIWRFFNRFTLDGPVSEVAELREVAAVDVFPNPTEGWIQISTQAPIGRLVLQDARGTVVRSGQGLYELDLAGLSAGIYFLGLELDGQWIVKKILRQ